MSSWGPFLEDLKKNGALRQEYRDGIPTTVRVTNHPTYFRMGVPGSRDLRPGHVDESTG